MAANGCLALLGRPICLAALCPARTSLCACICPSNLLFAYSLLRVFNPLPVPPADPEDPMRVTDQTRPLGLIVCRGTSVMLVVPTAGKRVVSWGVIFKRTYAIE